MLKSFTYGTSGLTTTTKLSAEGIEADLLTRKVHRGGEPVALSVTEFELLALLLRHAGRVVTQQQLLREIWGATHAHDSHYLRIVVGKLRQKLGDDPATPRWLKTEPGVGYRFISGV